MTNRPGSIHRLIVEGLGDEEALAAVGCDGFLSAEHWALAVERTRLRRYPTLTLEHGHRRVGEDLAAAFLGSDAGRLVAVTLPQLDLARAFTSVLMPLADRMRRAFEYDFEPQPWGGTVWVRGQRVLPSQHIEGFFAGLVKPIPGRHHVSIASATAEQLELRVEHLPG